MNTQIFRSVCLSVGILLWTASTAFAQRSPPESDRARAIVALVDKAAALIDAKGKAAFPEFRKTGSEWRSGDMYLFVIEMKGLQLLNAGFPKQDHTDVSGVKDSNGKLIVMDTIKMLQAKHAGWMNYMWPKAGQTKPLQKWSDVKVVNIEGKPAYVGAGFYPE
jgi:cytochrome c